jgi:hypothetical protein
VRKKVLELKTTFKPVATNFNGSGLARHLPIHMQPRLNFDSLRSKVVERDESYLTVSTLVVDVISKPDCITPLNVPPCFRL